MEIWGKRFMVNSVVGANEQQYKKPGFWISAGGVAAGLAASGITNGIIVPKISSVVTESKFFKQEINNDEYEQIEKGVKQVLEKDTDLAKKGVSILKYSPETKDEINSILKSEADTFAKFTPKIHKDAMVEEAAEAISTGSNAIYARANKKIVLPAEKLSISVFHEVGHASNNFGRIGNTLMKSRSLAILSFPLFLVALLKSKKSPDENSEGFIDKTTDFIKNNIGKLSFLTCLPILAEEGLASVKGVKFAKKVLDPKLLDKVKTDCKAGFLSYLITFATVSAASALAVKIKDCIAKPKPINENIEKQK